MADCLVPKWGRTCLRRGPARSSRAFTGSWPNARRLASPTSPVPTACWRSRSRATWPGTLPAEIFAPNRSRSGMTNPHAPVGRRSVDAIVAAADAGHARQDVAVLRRLLRQPDDAKRPDLLHHGRDLLARKVADRMAGVRFDLIALPDGDPQLAIRYRPVRLIDAVWQRLAEEIAGRITWARCPAPDCGPWFLRSAGRGDRQFCCHPCQMRTWRAGLDRSEGVSKAEHPL